MGYSKRECWYFGTENRLQWFRTPLQGAESSPENWSDGGSLLSGGGWQFESWGSHKVYQYEWGASTPIEWAQKIKSYADGTYGRGLVYFYDPLTYEKNLFPARWADPSMALDNEGTGLVYGVDPVSVPTPTNTNDYPITSATYDLTNISAGWRGREDAVFLPVPPGYTLLLGVSYTSTGTGGVFIRESNNGVLDANVRLDPLDINGDVVNTYISDCSGVWVYVGKSAPGASSVTIHGMTARLIDSKWVLGGYGLDAYGEEAYGSPTPRLNALSTGPWVGGMGHSGCRFIGKPTFESNTPLGGGQVGFAASFREVGSWLY